jgi:hypothetical protein
MVIGMFSVTKENMVGMIFFFKNDVRLRPFHPLVIEKF